MSSQCHAKMAGNTTIVAFPEDDNIMKWEAKITGLIGTVSACFCSSVFLPFLLIVL